jgi:hypothetical protein
MQAPLTTGDTLCAIEYNSKRQNSWYSQLLCRPLTEALTAMQCMFLVISLIAMTA